MKMNPKKVTKKQVADVTTHIQFHNLEDGVFVEIHYAHYPSLTSSQDPYYSKTTICNNGRIGRLGMENIHLSYCVADWFARLGVGCFEYSGEIKESFETAKRIMPNLWE